jgi:shikimate kinase/3-dehydroquinate synthase
MRRKGVAIGGMMGVGKSTVGERIATRMGLPFVDTDAVLEARFGPIPAQLTANPQTFRAREAAVVAEVTREPAVVATGGGAWVSEANRERLSELGSTVVLSAPLEVLRRRIGTGAGRPLASQLAPLLDERAQAYADADHQVDADAPLDQVIERILAAVDPVDRSAVGSLKQYELCLSRTLHGLPAAIERSGLTTRQAVVVSDVRVAEPWMAYAVELLQSSFEQVRTCVVEGGEAQKDRRTWSMIVDGLLAGPVDRSTVVVALGGGVVGDLAGFAAASVLRGLPWVLLPTTLLSLVDSSVGGKTGYNHRYGKNLVGAFHQPSLVYGALETLSTLPARQRVSGLGEVVKAAMIADPALFEFLETHAAAIRDGQPDVLAEVVARTVAIKAEIVAADEQERGRRRVLNLGHTVAHGLETALGYGVLLHGEAVSVGLIAETRWALRQGICRDRTLPDRLTALCQALGLPIAAPAVDRESVLSGMRLDKKGCGDTLWVPVTIRVGETAQVQVPWAGLTDLLG